MSLAQRDSIIAYMRRRFVPILENTGIPYQLDVVTNQLLQEHVAATLVRCADMLFLCPRAWVSLSLKITLAAWRVGATGHQTTCLSNSKVISFFFIVYFYVTWVSLEIVYFKVILPSYITECQLAGSRTYPQGDRALGNCERVQVSARRRNSKV